MPKATNGGQGAAEEDLFRPQMPEVDVLEHIEAVFNTARKAARGEAKLPGAREDRRSLILVTPGRMLMEVPCPPAGSLPPSRVAPLERLLPGPVKRNIAVIAYTGIKALQSDISKAIPFVGLLMGLAYLGHAVWIFEGHASALAAGCREADILLVDGGMLPHLPEGWPGVAAGVMCYPEIYVHDRASFQLRRMELK